MLGLLASSGVPYTRSSCICTNDLDMMTKTLKVTSTVSTNVEVGAPGRMHTGTNTKKATNPFGKSENTESGEHEAGFFSCRLPPIHVLAKCMDLKCLNATLHGVEQAETVSCIDYKCLSDSWDQDPNCIWEESPPKSPSGNPTEGATTTLAIVDNEPTINTKHKSSAATSSSKESDADILDDKTRTAVAEGKSATDAKKERGGSGGRIAIVTAVLKSTQGAHLNVEDTYSKIVSYALTNYNVYAQRYGYALFTSNAHLADPSRKFYWAKIPIIRHYLDLGFEWVFWTDIDWLFLNTSAPIESLIVPGKDIITSRECFQDVPPTKSMSGTMLLKNTRITRHMLDVWDGMYAQYKDNHNPEQEAFEVLMDVNGSFAQNHHNHNASDFMTYHYCHGPARDMIAQGGHFGIHFPGPDKVGIMHEYYSEWLQTLPENERPTQYLNMNFTPLE